MSNPLKDKDASVTLLPELPLTPTEALTTPTATSTPAKRPSPNPKGLMLFNTIKEARKALMAEAEAIRDLYMTNIKDAMAEGNHEVASEALQWLLEHMPADEDGVRIIDQNIDKPKADSNKSSGPQINIGVALGGMPSISKALPAVSVIDVDTKD